MGVYPSVRVSDTADSIIEYEVRFADANRGLGTHSYSAIALTGSTELAIAVAGIAVYLQWFHLIPYLWRLFSNESELKP